MANNRSTWNRGKGYSEDSKFESELKAGILKDLEYHPTKITYSIDHTYEPDWVVDTNKGFNVKRIFIEAKGMFREASELQKYVAVKKKLDLMTNNNELVFLFQYPHKEIYFKAKRKDGSRLSHAAWAEKHNIRWFTKETIKEIL